MECGQMTENRRLMTQAEKRDVLSDSILGGGELENLQLRR
jgi:hypothetical protein